MSDYRRITKRETKYLDGEIVCPELARLQELENKIEDGALIDMKVYLGQTIYKPSEYPDQVIYGKVSSIKYEVHVPFEKPQIVIYCDCSEEFNFNKTDWTKTIYGFVVEDIADIGTKVFLTKAEAEAKLKELRGEV